MERGAFGPRTPREGVLWNFFNRQDIFFRIISWPEWVQQIALKEHKNHRERYRFFLFLTFNGLDPDTAADWLLLRDVRPGKNRYENYDAAALAQLRDMISKCRTGELFQNVNVFDMNLGRVVTGVQ